MCLFVLIILNFINYDNSGIWVYSLPSNLEYYWCKGPLRASFKCPVLQRRKPERSKCWLRDAPLCWKWQSKVTRWLLMTVPHKQYVWNEMRKEKHLLSQLWSNHISNKYLTCTYVGCAGPERGPGERQDLYLRGVTFRGGRNPQSTMLFVRKLQVVIST